MYKLLIYFILLLVDFDFLIFYMGYKYRDKNKNKRVYLLYI